MPSNARRGSAEAPGGPATAGAEDPNAERPAAPVDGAASASRPPGEEAGGDGAEAGADGAGSGPDGAPAAPEPEAGEAPAAEGEPVAGGESEIEAEPEAGEEESLESLRAALEEARRRADAESEAQLRALAEMENLRKRAARDVEQAHRFGIEGLVNELLPVLDGLALGIEAASKEGSTPAALGEGTAMTQRMLLAALEKFGVAEIDPGGEAFDPERHQAVSTREAEGVEAGRVVEVVQKGFALNGRVVRAAMVVVSK